ncbi:3-hydroxy-2-methylbutyryl-CoA dehydrogenase [Sphingobium chlorophenolicum L-1]|uniref:3-hydroxy-2-methylbutyryl-CoA dehydrogenase n=1 Tax=Sphingobium chlorophenolicum L-1 TaxID=690566 RepID=F6EUI8_SPHCR|nr:SDR family NAD(P)-dependent oxidoreductase [Sphingobium chlorophenolicum]AEG47882.1 3-hydroxy-2-methylbutyryl-CoA dehydrogenase [Sphingobium chlorophenolicum L-1]
MDMENIAAVVSGGASGLGGATAARLAAGGAKVTILDLNETLGQQHAGAIGGHFVKTDVSDPASVAAALDEAQERHGIARLLVNCAGIGLAKKTVEKDGTAHDFAAFRKVIEINLLGSFNTASQFASRLVGLETEDEERGVIINTASVAAFDGQIGQAAYSASKGGIVGMTLPMARDLAQSRVRVVTIAPGLFLTPLLAGLPEAAQASLGQQVPFPSRLGNPDEYARMVEAIVTNPMLNGETIRLDGAIRMAPR